MVAQKKTEGGSNGVKLAVLGAGLAGLAATAYFFFGPKAKKNQRFAKAWAIKMKGDVIAKLEAAKEVTEPVYHEIINTVANEYAKGMKAAQPEIEMLANDLKKHWRTLSKAGRAAKKEVTKEAVKVVKVVKKAVK
jgi:hypothetical protein